MRIVAPNTHPLEFWPLWEDRYLPLNRVPPWPQGATEHQRKVIAGFDRAWVAALNPEPLSYSPTQDTIAFHGYQVRAFLEITSRSDLRMLRDAFKENLDWREPGWPPEGYPALGIRLQMGIDSVDLIVERKNRLIFIYDKHAKTFLRVNNASDIDGAVNKVSRNLPVDPNAD